MRGAALLVLLLAGCSFIASAAAQASVDRVEFGSLATARLVDAAVYADAGHLSDLDLRAPLLHVSVWRASYVELQTPSGPVLKQVSLTPAAYDLHDVVARLDKGDPSGWIGARGANTTTLSLLPGANIAYALTSQIGADAKVARDKPDEPFFAEPRASPHLTSSGFDTIGWTDTGELRFAGPDLLLVARENRTQLTTGWTHASGMQATTEATWATFELGPGSTLTIAGLDHAAAVASGGEVVWDGQARWTSLDGSERTSDEGRASLSVSSQGIVLAAPASTASGTAIPPLSPVSSDRWLFGILGLAVGAAIVGGVAWSRQERDPLRSWEVDDLATLAHDATEMGEHEEAKRWIRRARMRAPKSMRLALDEAYIEERAGNSGTARRLLEDLAQSGEPEASWLLARKLLEEGAHPADAERWILAALASKPSFALEMQDDAVFSGLESRPAIHAALDAALARLGHT